MKQLQWHQIAGTPPAGDVAVTPVGDITATDVQAALAQLDARVAATGSGGATSDGPVLAVADGVSPLEPVVADDDPTGEWLYADPWPTASTGSGGVTDHGALTGLADDDHALYLKGQSGRSYRAFGGVLRKDAGSWFLINDGSHRPLGLGAITVTSTYVEVAITLGATAATGFAVTPDETYAQNWTCGVSGGAAKLQIKFYKDKVLQNPLTMPDEPFGNFWIIGLAEAP